MFKLNCPHCTKTVEIAPSLAGQTTQCPLCGGPFTVPVPPAAPPPPAANPDPFLATQPYVSMEKESGRRPSAPPPPPPFAPSPTRLMPKFEGGWLPWVAPAGIILVFFLMFFPWIGVFCGSTVLVEQSGFGLAFGGLGGPREITGFTSAGVAPLMMLFFLTALVGLLVAMALVALPWAPPDLLRRVQPWPDRLLPHRPVVMLGLAATLLLLLTFHGFIPLPLESAAAGDKAVLLMTEGLRQKLEGEIKVKSGGADMVVMQWTRRTSWMGLAFLASLIATVAALLDWGMTRPGVRYLPVLRIDWQPIGAGAKAAAAAAAAAAPTPPSPPAAEPVPAAEPPPATPAEAVPPA